MKAIKSFREGQTWEPNPFLTKWVKGGVTKLKKHTKVKNMKHLRYYLYDAPIKHPQLVMKQLGITYQHVTPQSIADQWWFWNCENIPDTLPEYIEELNVDPFDVIGYGLSADDAKRITEWTNKKKI